MESFNPLTLIGIMLIIIGVILVILPLLAQYAPSLEKLPWIIFWVYKGDNFYFATSPLLIIISIIFVITSLAKNGK